MPWMGSRDAAAAMGCTQRRLQKRAARGDIERREVAAGRYEYLVPDAERAAPSRVEPAPSRSYYHDETRDRYVFTLPSKPRHPWVVSGDNVRSLVAAYAKDGDDATINQVARTFGWHRRTVVEVLRALGKTHDSLPFTDEHIAQADEGELVEDLVRRKEERVHIKAERAGWQQTKELAERARSWDRFLVEVMSGIHVPPLPHRAQVDAPIGDQTVISHATDLHYGKRGWLDGFDRAECERRLLATTGALVDRLRRIGTYRRAIVVAGGDWLHVDNHRGTTTKGTPQDVDGSFRDVFEGACSLARAQIEVWRELAPIVEVKIVRGNHDYWTTMLLGHWLRAVYRDDPHVRVGESHLDREYLEVGRTLVGLTHGDGVKDERLPSLMAHEAREAWGRTDRRLWLTGHWHSQIVTEAHGVIVRHLPSLAGTDEWHHRNGYVGQRRALQAHVLDDEDGVWADITQDAK